MNMTEKAINTIAARQALMVDHTGYFKIEMIDAINQFIFSAYSAIFAF